jgi:hypothetical protein
LNFRSFPAAAAVLLLSACGSGSSEEAVGGDVPVGPATTVVTTGLEGYVIRGPVQPVCINGQPCEEPFAATFHVKQDGNAVQQFTSGADGYFVVYLEPGAYEIVPDEAAPVHQPAQQARAISVGETGLTLVEVSFDTGIR